MSKYDAQMRNLARTIAECFGYEWDGLPEIEANHKNGQRIPPKIDFINAAEAANAEMKRWDAINDRS